MPARRNRHAAVVVAAAVVSLVPVSRRADAASKTWINTTSASWSLATAWSGSTVPANGDDVLLGTTSASGTITSTFASTYSGVGLNSLDINATAVSIFVVNQTAGAMIATTEIVGDTINGNTYSQTGGSNTASSLTIGNAGSGNGVYSLSGSSVLSAATQVVGNAGVGAFVQTGGSNTASSSLQIGVSNASSASSYSLSGGTLSLGNNANLTVGVAGKASFTQSAGVINFTGANPGDLILAANAANNSNSFTLSGTGQINNAAKLTVGQAGSASFIQTGGAVSLGVTGSVNGNLYVGDNANSSGAYSLSAATGAGTLRTDNEFIGNYGAGTFSQTGGTHTVGNNLNIGAFTGSSGTYTLAGGSFTSNTASVGVYGTGIFNHTAGSASFPSLTVGTSVSGLTGTGTYSLTGTGSLATGIVTVGFNTGSAAQFIQSGGTHTASGTLQVGVNAGSSGVYQLTAGSLSVANENIGVSNNPANTASFIQNGGTHTITGTGALSLGINAGSAGSYLLDASAGASQLTAYSLTVGKAGSGTFTQNGGSNQLTGPSSLTLGALAGSNGSYNLGGSSASTLTVSSFEALGAAGTGLFTQTGGIHTLTGDMQLGQLPSGNGTYQMNGGTLNVNFNIGVGQAGTGAFNQTAGTTTVTAGLYVGSGTGSTGTLNLSGGTLSAGTVYAAYSGNGTVNQYGGTLTVGTLFAGFNTSGVVNQYNGTLNVTSNLYVGLNNTQPAAYNLSGGTLNLPNSPNTFNDGFILSNNVFTQTGGTLNGYLYNAGQFNFQGGTFNGTLLNGPTGTATFTSFVYVGTALDNQGALNIPGGQVGTAAGKNFNNEGTITLSSNGQIYSSGPVTNNGLITGTGTIGGSAGFTNNLAVTQGAGPLSLFVTTSNFGTFTLATSRVFNLGATLTNSGTFNVNAANVVNYGGTLLNAPGGTVNGPGTIGSPFANNGTLLPGSGTLYIPNAWNNTGVVQLAGLPSSLIGGAITNSGTVQGTGTVGSPLNNVANGTVEALGGTLVLSGATTNAAGATLAASAGNKLLLSTGLVANAGVISLTGGTFDNNGLPLSNTGQISGYGTLRTGGSGLTNAGSITLTGGPTTVNGPLTNNPAQTVKVLYNPATFTGPVTNNGTFTVTATTATFAGGFSGTSPSEPSGIAGTSLSPNLLAPSLTGTLLVNPAALVQANFVRQDTVTSSGAIAIRPAAQGGDTSAINALTLSPGAAFDLADTKLILSSPATPAATLRSYLQSARLFSSTANADPQHRLALGYIDNSLLGAATWGGLPTDPSSLLLKPTYLGDANLDGTINADDYALLDRGFQQHASTWAFGDFNYDGQVTSADYLLIDRVYVQQTGTLSPSLLAERESQFGPAYVQALLTSIPEPSTLAACGLASLLPLTRRRRT